MHESEQQSDRWLTPAEMEEALAGFPVVQPPARLFRFQSKAGLSALTHGKLKITPPAEFNDPFEIAPGVASDGLTPEAMRQAFLSQSGLARLGRSKKHSSEADYRDWIESVMLAHPERWIQTLRNMRFAMTEATSKVYGIACFSAFTGEILNGPIGIRHWSAYADDHKGFAIEYDGSSPLFKTLAESKWLFPVKYHEERPRVQIADFDEWSQQKTLRILRHWSEMKCAQAWGCEMERRLICQLAPDPRGKLEISRMERENQSPLYFFHLWKTNTPSGEEKDAAAIKRVILGARTPEQLREDIVAALRHPHLRHVELLQARLCDERFALKIEGP